MILFLYFVLLFNFKERRCGQESEIKDTRKEKGDIFLGHLKEWKFWSIERRLQANFKTQKLES